MALIILFLYSLLLGQLGGISPFPGVVLYVHDIILALLVLINLRRIKFVLPMMLFPVFCFVSLVANTWRFPLQDLGFGSLYLIRWVMYASLFSIVIQDKKKITVWLHGLYATGVGFGLLGLVQFFLYPDLRNLSYLGWDPHFQRIFSTLLDPNFMGIIFVFTLILGVGLCSKNNRMWILAGEIITFISLLLTYSRSSYLAFCVAIVVLTFMRKQWKLLGVLTVFGVFVVLLSFVSTDALKLTRAPSALARVGNWQKSMTLIGKSPVFGYGFDTLRYLNGDTLSKAAAGVDSSLLFVFATTGIVGFASYVYLLCWLFQSGKKSPVYIASFIAILIHSFFVNSLFYPWVMIWMWILAASVIFRVTVV